METTIMTVNWTKFVEMANSPWFAYYCWIERDETWVYLQNKTVYARTPLVEKGDYRDLTLEVFGLGVKVRGTQSH
jgi:hypothetical protein